jgi:hypothetical protein
MEKNNTLDKGRFRNESGNSVDSDDNFPAKTVADSPVAFRNRSKSNNQPLYICHRINTIAELKQIPIEYGIEIDLRDKENNIILAHDPFCDGELFTNFLKYFNHAYIILNIKSERIEYKILDILNEYNIPKTKYFFLDSSFPMIYNLSTKYNVTNIAIRLSEFESIESVIKVKDIIQWVWIDCFTKFSLTMDDYQKIKNAGLKICIVSPELQGHDIQKINEFKTIISDNNFIIDAICTKKYNIDKWN